MKNLLVYIHPNKSFENDYYNEMAVLAKVQIDNSLAFGWRREDVIIATNFPYEYNGVKSIVVPDYVFSEKKRTVSKINAILYLFEIGAIADELFWFHDFDAFQNAPLGEVRLDGKVLALTPSSIDYGRFSTGILFFSRKAEGLLTHIQVICFKHQIDEEAALRLLVRQYPVAEELLILNLSHNFAIRKRDVPAQYAVADKPIKVLHFHPFDKRVCTPTDTPLTVASSLMGETLRDTFIKHKIFE